MVRRCTHDKIEDRDDHEDPDLEQADDTATDIRGCVLGDIGGRNGMNAANSKVRDSACCWTGPRLAFPCPTCHPA
jgi:hypothetical protein